MTGTGGKRGGRSRFPAARRLDATALGQPVKPSVIYRLLARHGWRKVAPDTRHPKSQPEVQEAWKKNSRKNWQPC